MITKQTAIAGTLLLVLLPSGFSCLRSDAVAAAPDLVWTPQPWRFESGPSVRYIDFENVDDNARRTSDIPVNDGRWHHVMAEVERSDRQGIHLYVDGALHNGPWSGRIVTAASLANHADFAVGRTDIGPAGQHVRPEYFAGQIDFLRISRGTLADAETTIEELYRWEFDGPFLKDFYSRPPDGAGRDAGALEFDARSTFGE